MIRILLILLFIASNLYSVSRETTVQILPLANTTTGAWTFDDRTGTHAQDSSGFVSIGTMVSLILFSWIGRSERLDSKSCGP